MNFDQIPVNLLTPGQYVEVVAAPTGSTQRHRILVLGQKTSAGSAAANTPMEVLAASQVPALFGRGSIIGAMLLTIFAVNPEAEIWACAQSDGDSDVAATASIALSGTATEAGNLSLLVGGYAAKVAVAVGDAAATVASRLKAALDAVLELPFSAVLSTATVNLTAKNKGLLGNTLRLEINHFRGERTPAGLAVVLTQPASGTGAGSIAAAITAIATLEATSIVCPYTDSTTIGLLVTELERRWGPLVQLEAHGFTAIGGGLEALTGFTESLNAPWLTVMGVLGPTPSWVWAAVTAAVDESELDPARPRQTLHLKGVIAPTTMQRWDRETRQTLLENGIATHTVDANGNARVERLVTTYRTDDNGGPDGRYRDIEILRNLAYQRYHVRTRLAGKYARFKLANDGTAVAPGQPVVTPKLLRAELIALYREFEQQGLVENLDAFLTELVVERDGTDPGRINALIPPDLINQLRVFAAQIQFTV